jgi:hypothetical protein
VLDSPLFSNSAEVLRTDLDGHHIVKRFDLSELEKGRQVDAQVESGDVVVVEKTAALHSPMPCTRVSNTSEPALGLGVPMP